MSVKSTYWAACRQAARKVLGVPTFCATSIVNTLFKKDVVKCTVFRKFLSLNRCLETSTNETARFMYFNAISDARSIIARNLNCIKTEWGSLDEPCVVDDISPECSAVKELLDVRQGLLTLSLESDEVDALMAVVCLR